MAWSVRSVTCMAESSPRDLTILPKSTRTAVYLMWYIILTSRQAGATGVQACLGWASPFKSPHRTIVLGFWIEYACRKKSFVFGTNGRPEVLAFWRHLVPHLRNPQHCSRFRYVNCYRWRWCIAKVGSTCNVSKSCHTTYMNISARFTQNFLFHSDFSIHIENCVHVHHGL